MINRRWLVVIVCIFTALLTLGLLLRAPAIAQTSTINPAAPASQPLSDVTGKIDNALRAELVQRAPDEMVQVIVYLRQTAVLPSPSLSATTTAHRAAVIASLQQTAVSAQAPLRRQLDTWQQDGQVTTYRPFWIVNAIAVTAAAQTIPRIAARPEVAAITLDNQHRYFDPPANDWALGGGDEWLETARIQTTSASTASWGIERINAAAVWHGLGIDGSGVTVATMDSGVDWLHPDLYPNYRGNLGGGAVDHTGSWYHTRYPSITVPMDALGHGTHVMGTAVGQNGIGVAPGANWIAVSIADEHGFIYDSDVHAGFQWLMAPAGDPALAPDIINNSWSGSPYSVNFVKDIATLQAAGIMTVFSAGNNGPAPETIGSPASYTDTLSVAASAGDDSLAWFSSRGPSPLTASQNPWLAAPGTRIISALPGGQYGKMSGTSMAAPHVVGVMALLLSANPTLTRLEIMKILADTAVPMTATHPNNNSGWGRLDAYTAVSTQAQAGTLQGIVQDDKTPLPGVSVAITATDGAALQFETDADGRFQARLQPGIYALRTSPFGFVPISVENLTVTANQATTQDLSLTQLPAGTVSGIVTQAGSNAPLTATITVLDTPLAVETDEDGRYTLHLPAAQYKLRAEAAGHSLSHAVILLQSGQTVAQNFTLETAPTILLVDSGQWYFDSYADYYEDSLTALNYSFDTWAIRSPFAPPALSDLAGYDTVIWSSPSDSPGFIGAGSVISDYLGLGGNLLISGQHVGSYDGQGFDTQLWWYHHLEADFRGKTAVTTPLHGADDTLFAGLNPTLNDAGSANNQTGPDQSRPRPRSLTQPTFTFDDDLAGGLQAGHCQPYRIAYFGFGLEGVSAYDRAAILSRSFDYFAAPRLATGLQWSPTMVDDFAVAGEQLVYTLTVRNMSETMTDTFHLAITAADWPASLITDTLTLGACQSGQTVLTIDAPPAALADEENETVVTAVSANNPAIAAAINLRHKTPGHILLVDDDRWYDQEEIFKAMLDEMNLTYDVWEIGWDNNVRGSPSAAFLNAYDIVLWYTAYDWFAPVTPAENETLTQYLAQGGRLFLTSQDYLYYHHESALATDYLGIGEYREFITPTQVYGAGNAMLAPDLAGPLPLDFTPYQNFSDGVVPTTDQSQPFVWLDKGIPGGVANAGADWRALFLSFPLEKLPEAARSAMMNNIVGWLSDLGDSTFAVNQRTALAGEALTYTITLRNLPAAPSNQVAITNTLPVSLSLAPGTISGGAVYDAGSRQLTWSGQLAGGGEQQISYRAVPAPGLADGALLENKLQVYYGRHALTFERTAAVWVNAPDLSRSSLTAVANAPAATQRITYTLRLVNDGHQAAAGVEGVTAVIRFSEPLTPVLSALAMTQGSAYLNATRLVWAGDLGVGAVATVTLALERAPSFTRRWLPVTAVLNDNITPIQLIYNQLPLPLYTYYFPLIARTK